VDESGFYLLPSLVKSYAPRGHPPILRVHQGRDHLSVMGGVTPEGELYTLIRASALNGSHSVVFLKHLRVRLERKLLVVWDGSPIHRDKTVKAYLAEGAGEFIHLESLPGYAPDLNPQEGIWNHLKDDELANVSCPDLKDLGHQLRGAIKRLRHKQDLIQACFAEAGLSI
jgi:transposase